MTSRQWIAGLQLVAYLAITGMLAPQHLAEHAVAMARPLAKCAATSAEKSVPGRRTCSCKCHHSPISKKIDSATEPTDSSSDSSSNDEHGCQICLSIAQKTAAGPVLIAVETTADPIVAVPTAFVPVNIPGNRLLHLSRGPPIL